MYIDKLDNIVNIYNNTYHSTIKMKPVDVKSNPYLNSDKKINNKDPKFKIGDIVRISKYKSIFAKGYVPSWSEEVLHKLKILCRGQILLAILKVTKFLERFTKKNYKKTNKKDFRVEKMIKEKGDKLYVKWKGYESSFNSWINKRDIV